PRGQPDAARADRLDAARAHAQEHRSARERGAAVAARHLGRRGLGEPLVARAAAQGPPAGDRGTLTPAIATRHETVKVWQGRVPFRIRVEGQGPPVVFFHGPWGFAESAFVDALARTRTVYAPEHPGTTPGEPDAIHQVDSLWDLILCYDEVLDHLKL